MSPTGRVRPSKPTSAFGIIVAVVVMILGLSFGVTEFGAFGFVWILAALGIILFFVLNLVSKRGVAEQIIEFDSAPKAPADTISSKTTEDRLRELDDLKKKGLVSENEYGEQRKKILGDM